MMQIQLSPEQRRKLTESEFWRPEVGRAVAVTIAKLGYKELRFKGEQGDPRPTLVMSVIVINGYVQQPPKLWTSTNKRLNDTIIQLAEAALVRGHETLKVVVERKDERNWEIADAFVIEQATGQRLDVPPTTPTRRF